MTDFRILDIHCNEVRFKLNLLKAEPNTKFEITPQFHVTGGKNKENPKRRVVRMTVDIKNTESNPQPFDIYVELLTTIELAEEIWLVEDEHEFMRDASRVIYPYLRNCISALTNTAMVPSFTIPPLDGAMLYRPKEN